MMYVPCTCVSCLTCMRDREGYDEYDEIDLHDGCISHHHRNTHTHHQQLQVMSRFARHMGLFTKKGTSTVCKMRDNDLNLTVRSKTSEIDVSR